MGLTEKLLKVSNSSYYGMRQVIGALKLALVILGINEVAWGQLPSAALASSQ